MSLPPGPLSPTLLAVLDVPAALPPPGITANLINPPHSPLALANVVTCICIATLAVSIRVYTKLFLMKQVIVEDCFLLLGYASTMAYYGCGLVVDQFGKGTHQWNVRIRDLVNVIYWTQICGTVYIPAMLFLKLAILCQLLRIFVVNKRQSRGLWLAIWLNIWALVAYYTFQLFFNIFLCTPRHKLWDPFLQEGSCLNRYATWTANGAINLATDVVILVLPIWSILKLNMPRKKKAGYIAIFGIGIIACLTSAMRASMWNLLREEDLTRELMKFGAWTAWELTIGIVIASTPGLPRFFQTYGPRVSGAFSKLLTRSKTSLQSLKFGSSDASASAEYGLHDHTHEKSVPRYTPDDEENVSNSSLQDRLSIEHHAVTFTAHQKPEVNRMV